ncbi:MAG: hypothetical protein IJV22_03495 [Bacteroidales bacterium]|nr:hypothetical protein [Bacteroidales bacterium]
MERTKLVRISSITKKLVVALLGAFLLLFLLFHMCANLCVLREDDGAWYSAFCHFMGSNIFVKVAEVVLLAVLLLHIVISLLLQVGNHKARPVGYHERSRTRTAKGSKLAMWTGILLLAFLIMHFFQFYFVKIGLVEGSYMTKVESVYTEPVVSLQQAHRQLSVSAEEFVSRYEQELPSMAGQYSEVDYQRMQENIAELRRVVPVVSLLDSAMNEKTMITKDGKWLRHLTVQDKAMLKAAIDDIDVEPDFYFQARNLFKNPIMVCLYILAFVVLWLHMRHAFESAFQTLGLNNYKYSRAIEVIGIIYAWLICLGFAAVPIYVLLFV